MAAAQLTHTGDGTYALRGELGFATVTQLLQQSRTLFAGVADIELDLSAVTHADSAGLSLLIEWLRQAHGVGVELRYRQLPAQLRSLAAISDLEELLTQAT